MQYRVIDDVPDAVHGGRGEGACGACLLVGVERWRDEHQGVQSLERRLPGLVVGQVEGGGLVGPGPAGLVGRSVAAHQSPDQPAPAGQGGDDRLAGSPAGPDTPVQDIAWSPLRGSLSERCTPICMITE